MADLSLNAGSTGSSVLNPTLTPSSVSTTNSSTPLVGQSNGPGLLGGIINTLATGNPSTGFSSTTNFPLYNSQTALNTTSVNTTPTAHTVSGATPAIVAPPTTDTTQDTLSATSNGYMTPPPNTTQNENGTATQNPPSPDATNSTRDAVMQRILDNSNTLATEGDVQNQLNTQFGVDTKQQNYIDAYNQYQSKSVQYKQQIDKILSNPNITHEQAVQQASEIQRVNNADLANLAIITQTAQGNYTAALDIVQRKLDAQFKPLQTQIDNLGTYLQNNNANLTDKQKTQIQVQQYQLQNNLDLLKTAETAAHQFALQQGITDPQVLAKIDAAKTPADAYAAVGMSAPSTNGGAAGASIDSQYQSYVTQTQGGIQYVGQDKLANLTPFQQQEAARQYAAAGIHILNTEQTQKIQNIDVTQQNLAGLQDVINGKDVTTGAQGSPLLGSGVAGRIGSSVTNFVSNLTQSNPNIAAFNNYRLTAINTLQSLGAGSGGSRITAAEIATAVSNLPVLTDNMETAQTKLTIVNGFLSKWSNELLPNNSSSGSGTQVVQTKAGSISTNW